jgi:endonuclease-3
MTTMSGKQRMRQVLELLEDHYGSDCGPPEELRDPFRTLIGCILSHRTREENSSMAAANLFEAADDPDAIIGMSPKELRGRIRCSGFYNQKARNIRAICLELNTRFNGRVPEDRSQLISLPGVGPKTADIVLSYAYGRPGIPVDVHVATVAKRLGLVSRQASQEETKEQLEALCTRDRYGFLDHAFFRLGKEYCRTRDSRCGKCPLDTVCDHQRLADDK